MYFKLILLTFFLTASLVANAQTASFSCQINGQTFAYTGGNAMSNACFKTAPDLINIGLVSLDPKYKTGTPPQIQMYLLPSGTTTIKNNEGKYNFHYTAANEIEPYAPGSFTVTITSYSQAHVIGTFSGTLKNLAGKTITITNGKFDVPVSPYSNIK